jgi:Domain of unknown function (DUF2017)
VAQVLRRRGRIQVKLNAQERDALLSIIDGLTPQLAGMSSATPRAYEDAQLQSEYDRWVRPEIERGRDADIAVVRDSLSAGDNALLLTEAQALCWLRAFNHLRIAAGGILGIEADGWEEQTDQATRQRPEYGVLLALGYLQEELVATLES